MTTHRPPWLTMSRDAFERQYRPPQNASAKYLHRVLIRALGPAAVSVPSEGLLRRKPLVVDLASPLPRRLRFYMYRATQESSDRHDAFSAQITVGVAVPGQDSSRRYFDRTGNTRPILIGYHPDLCVFILWDADLHDIDRGFPISKAVQAPPEIVWDALARGIANGARTLKKPPFRESIIAARPSQIERALELRIRLSNQALLEGSA